MDERKAKMKIAIIVLPKNKREKVLWNSTGES